MGRNAGGRLQWSVEMTQMGSIVNNGVSPVGHCCTARVIMPLYCAICFCGVLRRKT